MQSSKILEFEELPPFVLRTVTTQVVVGSTEGIREKGRRMKCNMNTFWIPCHEIHSRKKQIGHEHWKIVCRMLILGVCSLF